MSLTQAPDGNVHQRASTVMAPGIPMAAFNQTHSVSMFEMVCLLGYPYQTVLRSAERNMYQTCRATVPR